MPEIKGKPESVKVFTKWASLHKGLGQTPRTQIEWLFPLEAAEREGTQKDVVATYILLWSSSVTAVMSPLILGLIKVLDPSGKFPETVE